MKIGNLIVLNLLVPLVSAVALSGVRNVFCKMFLHLFVPSFLLLITALALFVFNQDVSYVFGGFDKMHGVEFLVTRDRLLVLMLIYLVYLLCAFSQYALHVVNRHFVIFTFLFVASLTGVVLVNDFFTFYVFIELSAISVYGIFNIRKTPLMFKSIFNYLINNSIASVFFLIGVLFVYRVAKTLNFSILIETFTHTSNPSIIFGLFMMTCAILFKIGLYPMHSIVLNLYRDHGNDANLLVQPIMSKVYFFSVLKLFFIISHVGNNNLGIYLAYIGALGALAVGIKMNMLHHVSVFFGHVSFYQLSYLVSILFIAYEPIKVEAIIRMMAINALIHFLALSVSNQASKFMKEDSLDLVTFGSMMHASKFYRALFTVILGILAGLPISYVFLLKLDILRVLLAQNHLLLFVIHILSSLFLFLALLRFLYFILVPNVFVSKEFSTLSPLPFFRLLVLLVASLISII